MKLIAGFDIGGTKCAALLALAEGEGIQFLSRREIPTKGSWREILDSLVGLIAEQKAAAGLEADRLTGTGVSCGGPLDAKAGLILSPPNLPGWDGVPVCGYLRERLGCPVRLKNDADACALAEWRYGAGRGCENMVFLTFGTGLGAGLILGGKLYEGTSSMAGELGHWRMTERGPEGYGKQGSLEGWCSGGGIARTAELVRKNFSGRTALGAGSSAKEVCQLAREGDPGALEVMRLCGETFGRGMSYVIDLLNPERIVAGGVFMRAHDLILPHARAVIRREALPRSAEACRILPAALGEQIGDYGAVCAFLE